MNEEVKDNLSIRFTKICSLVNVINSQKKATFSSDPNGVEMIRLLRALCNDFIKASKLHSDLKILTHISKGRGCLPRIIWLAFTLKGKPSTSTCAALCFDKMGKGCVMGVMDSVSNPNYALKTVTRRNEKITPELDVDGPHTKYANKFINPKDFLLNDFDSKKIVLHFDECITELKKY
jgi:hypothetical protein